MRTRTWCVAAALVCLPRLLAAQTVLSEADALARLSADSPRVRAIRAGVDVARADVLAAGRWPNPRFTYNREAVAGVTENMFLVTQALPVTGRRGLDVDAATALVAASERRADQEVRQVRAALRRRLRRSRLGAGARGRDRPRSRPAARTDRHPRAARGGRRRGRLRPASRRAGGDGSRRRMVGGSSRSCAGAGRAGRLLRRLRRRARASPLSFRSLRRGLRYRASEALVAHAETTLPRARRAAAGDRVRRICRAGGRPAAHSRAGNRRGHQVVQPRRRRHRRCLQRSRHAPAVRSRETRERAGGGAPRSGRRHASRRSNRCCARRSPRFARSSSNASRRPTRTGHRPQPARASSASRRSATTPASAAFSNCSTPIAPAQRPERGRRCSMPPRVRRRSSSNW